MEDYKEEGEGRRKRMEEREGRKERRKGGIKNGGKGRRKIKMDS